MYQPGFQLWYIGPLVVVAIVVAKQVALVAQVLAGLAVFHTVPLWAHTEATGFVDLGVWLGLPLWPVTVTRLVTVLLTVGALHAPHLGLLLLLRFFSFSCLLLQLLLLLLHFFFCCLAGALAHLAPGSGTS